ncbi:hypothetical protein CRG98_045808 [Punica granatum]|uniref:Formiminotransferase N-terminal subdomain domain-containing protein n=1 Tax=Punica granatum TaxID=22663 RepID=A0A2I0HQ05_PUNGR|nr:hypothetical protein CRG98_045808 [Punica granatum]
MLKAMLACGKVYISESRNRVALESIERAARLSKGAAIVNKFEDAIYNRVGYTVVSRLAEKPMPDSCPLKAAVLAMVKAAFDAVDLELHLGSHPRLGVVDHICFHPLAQTSVDQVVLTARSLAMDIGSGLQVPAFLYGAAHEEGRTLDSIRRALGYFKPNLSGNLWAGGLNSNPLPLKPDEGPSQAAQGKVSGRGGGLPSVQAMALAHGNGITEVACNLLDPGRVGAAEVQQEVERLAADEGLTVGKGYFTDFSCQTVIEKYLQMDSHV